jgi:hypothetical protein
LFALVCVGVVPHCAAQALQAIAALFSCLGIAWEYLVRCRAC